MNVVEEYWSGVSQRLQTEVDVINRLVKHNGEVGRANENSLSTLLREMLPSSIGVGTGIVIDSSGRRSKQTDIILFDVSNQPQMLAQTTQLLFPIETVLMAVEVKTTLDAAAVQDVGEKCSALRELEDSRGCQGPALGLFSYHCSGAAASIGIALKDLGFNKRPDVSCIVNPGIIGLPDTEAGEGGVHFVPLHDRDEFGERISEQWAMPPDEHKGAYVAYGESLYPISRLLPKARERYVFDPGRALLLFCSEMLTVLATKKVVEVNWLQHYLSGTARETIAIS